MEPHARKTKEMHTPQEQGRLKRRIHLRSRVECEDRQQGAPREELEDWLLKHRELHGLGSAPGTPGSQTAGGAAAQSEPLTGARREWLQVVRAVSGTTESSLPPLAGKLDILYGPQPVFLFLCCMGFPHYFKLRSFVFR